MVPVQLDGSQSFDPEQDPLTFSWFEGSSLVASRPTPVVELGAGDHSIDLVVSDGTSSSLPSRVEIAIRTDVAPPQIACPTDLAVECHGHRGIARFAATATDDCAAASTACLPASGSSFALGTTHDTCTARDASGNTSSCGFDVTVRDSLAPAVTISSRPVVLWPPDHRYHTFQLSDCVSRVVDACDGTLDIDRVGRITKVTSDEPERRDGDDHGRRHDDYDDSRRRNDDDDTCRDIIITSNSSVKLRAERDDGLRDHGRVYTVFFEVPDASGNALARSCQIAVPREPRNAAVIDGCQLCEGVGCGSCPSHAASCR
jgi:hypothetical protein